MATEWFYQAQGQQVGPLSAVAFRRLASAGTITPDTLVCRATATGVADGRWTCAAKVEGLFQGSESPRTTSDSQKEPRPLPSPPPLPPSVPPVESDSPRRLNRRLLAAVLATAGAVIVVLMATVLLMHPSGKDVVSTPTTDWEKQLADVPVVSPQPAKPWRPPEDAVLANQDVPVVSPRPAQQPAQSSSSPSPKDVGPASGKPLDPVALYANCRGAVATISTKDDLGYDAWQGSGFFIPPELVGPGWWEQDEQVGTRASRNVGQCPICPPSDQLSCDSLGGNRRGATWQWSSVAHRGGRCHARKCGSRSCACFFLGAVEQVKPIHRRTNFNSRHTQGPELPIGAKVYAIGSPKGLEASLSEGIISGRREVAEGIWHLQTTTPISPGSSGGPLLDSTGQVVGVTTWTRRGGQNLNFAIPASQVLALLKVRPYNYRAVCAALGSRRRKSLRITARRFLAL